MASFERGQRSRARSPRPGNLQILEDPESFEGEGAPRVLQSSLGMTRFTISR